MGMRTGIYGNGIQGAPVRGPGGAAAGYSAGTSSFPVTGFPASAYLGNNRRVSGGSQASSSTVSSALGNLQQLDGKHVAIALGLAVVVGYTLWHLDNKR